MNGDKKRSRTRVIYSDSSDTVGNALLSMVSHNLERKKVAVIAKKKTHHSEQRNM
jgi:hypothetical protein